MAKQDKIYTQDEISIKQKETSLVLGKTHFLGGSFQSKWQNKSTFTTIAFEEGRRIEVGTRT